jgi:hypothetical protein
MASGLGRGTMAVCAKEGVRLEAVVHMTAKKNKALVIRFKDNNLV